MFSTFTRSFSNASVFGSLRDMAKNVSQEFVIEGMKQHFNRWADHIYETGMSMKDEKSMKDYSKLVASDIEAMKRQVVIQKLYSDK